MGQAAYLTVTEAARAWALSTRRVQSYCVDGRIPGAEKWGRAWMIPKGATRPTDGRRGKAAVHMPFLRECPLPLLTDAYTRPDRADETTSLLQGRPGAALCLAYLKYLRGDMEAALEGARRCLQEEAGFYAQIGAGTLMSLCAMHRGDEAMWNEARACILAAPRRGDGDEALRAFWFSAADSAIYGDGGYPEWFCQGNLNVLPADSQPSARFFYVKHLYLQSVDALKEKGRADAESVCRVRLLPCVAEPLIAQTRLEGVYVAEIYLRLICAVCYHVAGEDARAAAHIDRAVALALPDRLYAPLAEYEVNLDTLLDSRRRALDEDAYQAVRRINRRMGEGWVALHNKVRARNVSARLTVREREAARLAAMGMSNSEIARRQNVSVSTVKQSLRSAMGKTGAQNRAELAKYI